MPSTFRGALCSNPFHCCRDCVWEEGVVVQKCGRTDDEHLRHDPLDADEHCDNCEHCFTESNPIGIMSRMFLCPLCGNKRCPKATFHGNVCTGSNEPGQPGSSY